MKNKELFYCWGKFSALLSGLKQGVWRERAYLREFEEGPPFSMDGNGCSAVPTRKCPLTWEEFRTHRSAAMQYLFKTFLVGIGFSKTNDLSL
ncbi:hypothetical protein NITGR_260035 [Nitrospina gracilis 3/211]|uniref:Uncharacterized protein n=1 Tax=Nitrospina gracilis (strain 3/211) TaxID=1266370 RepID=M1YXN1_NITG3|nr:hypothetical protein NITGR_260035 [Nitrospina gracilis 3/211]